MVRPSLTLVLGLLVLSGCANDDDANPGADTGSPDSGVNAGTDVGADAGDDADPGPVDPLALPAELVPEGDEFIVAVLPDTQIYAERFPETFESQTRWIAEHAEEYRIVFVSHVGDIVQTGSVDAEWDVARAAYDWLDDIDMPHGFSIASHDTNPGPTDVPFDSTCSRYGGLDCGAIQFKRRFGAERYADRPWYGGTSPSGLSSWQRIEVDGRSLIFLHLPQDVPVNELTWATEVLDANPGTLVHLTTHRYLFDYRLTEWLPEPLSFLTAGRFNALSYQLGEQNLIYNDGRTADELFEGLVGIHPNIWLVHCGHVDAEFYQSTRNAAGLPVHEVLADFQDMADGGGGWLRLLIYRPSQNEVEVVTFSTLTGRVRENGEGFDHSIEILQTYRQAYGEDLESFGLDSALLDSLLASVSQPGPDREAYRASLYDTGNRDSRFVLPLDMDAYIEASR